MKEYIDINTKKRVEAIQWNGDNQKEVSEFVERVSSVFCTNCYGHKNLTVGYLDSKQNNHIANIPKFGWVVIEGKTLQFYKDETFKKMFKAAEDDVNGIDWEGMTGIINKAFEDLDNISKGFHGVPKEQIQKVVDEQAKMRKDPFYVPANEDACKDNDKKWREGMEKKTKTMLYVGPNVTLDWFNGLGNVTINAGTEVEVKSDDTIVAVKKDSLIKVTPYFVSPKYLVKKRQ